MTRTPQKKSPKNTSPKDVAREGALLIIFLGLTYIATIAFYILLTLGVIMIVTPLFTPTTDRWMIIGFGIALIAINLTGNIIGNRVSTGKWKLTWPSIPGGL